MCLWPCCRHSGKHFAPRAPEQSLHSPVPEHFPAQQPAPSQRPSAACRHCLLGLLRKEMTLPQRGHSGSQNRSCISAEEPPRPQLILTSFLPDFSTKGNRSYTNLEKYLDWHEVILWVQASDTAPNDLKKIKNTKDLTLYETSILLCEGKEAMERQTELTDRAVHPTPAW